MMQKVIRVWKTIKILDMWKERQNSSKQSSTLEYKIFVNFV